MAKLKSKTPTTRRIGDVAKTGGVGVETIRFYEREGFMEQPLKPVRGWREYGERQLQQLLYVRLGQELGLTLRDVRTVQASGREEKAKFCGVVRETVANRLAAIEAEIATLKHKRDGLKQWLGQCRARGQSADCPLYSQIQPLVGRAKGRNR